MLQKSSWFAALSLGMNMYSESKEGSLAELTQQTVLPFAPAQMLSNWADDSVKRQVKAKRNVFTPIFAEDRLWTETETR